MARGRLRIYLGAAPGVGKTVAMLGEGHRRAERGTDVVVALCETYGRPHTAALLDGLEDVPRRRLEYRGTVLEEMDVDAVLARRPRVALVDELAHAAGEDTFTYGLLYQQEDDLARTTREQLAAALKALHKTMK